MEADPFGSLKLEPKPLAPLGLALAKLGIASTHTHPLGKHETSVDALRVELTGSALCHLTFYTDGRKLSLSIFDIQGEEVLNCRLERVS